MDTIPTGQVALLIDFENLVRGLQEGPSSLDCGILFGLAEEYGRVLLANAYADWRIKDLNQYQEELYRMGVELIHVMGKRSGEGYKNAVDVRMAVDAVRTLASMPYIDVFVIVSGDRDFIHILKELRRNRKFVIGISPASSASDDLANLCDRFVKYEDLVSTFGPRRNSTRDSGEYADPPGMEEVKEALRAVLARHPDGIMGSQVKPLLRRRLSPSFDESTYGYSQLTQMLLDLRDVARVEFPQGPGDIRVFPARGGRERPRGSERREGVPPDDWVRRAQLERYAFERDPELRRAVLDALFDAMEGRETFTWREIEEDLDSGPLEGRVERDVTRGYLTILYHARGFVILPNQGDLPKEERAMKLPGEIRTREDFTRLYEEAVASKVRGAAGFDSYVPPEVLAEVLGLSREDPDALDYCRTLLSRSPWNN